VHAAAGYGYLLLDAGSRHGTIAGMSDKSDRRSYSYGYAVGYQQGYDEGRKAGLKERPDREILEAWINDTQTLETFFNKNLAAIRLESLLDLENENARLIAKLRGYVLAGSAKGAGTLVRHNTVTARGISRWQYKPQHRYPFVLGPDGWKRAKGRLRVEDWAMRLPPKVCELCGHLFVTGRQDARTCSPRCRTALHRRRHQPEGSPPL
jgi:hypothetical protein